MFSVTRYNIFIVCLDLSIAFLALLLLNHLNAAPPLDWLFGTSVIWVVFGIASGKLKFGAYKKVKNALVGISVLDIIAGYLIYFAFSYSIPNYEQGTKLMLAVAGIMLLEFCLYFTMRTFVFYKIPFYYEDAPADEIAIPGTAKNGETTSQIQHDDIITVLDILEQEKNLKQVVEWINTHQGLFSEKTIISESGNPERVLADKIRNPESIIHIYPLNKVKHLDTFLAYSNYTLDYGNEILCHFTPQRVRKERILRQSPLGINYMIYFGDYCWNRVAAKIPLTKKIYRLISGSKDRVFSQIEVLGRLYRSGFEVTQETVIRGEVYIVGVKTKLPIRDDKPSQSALIRLRRVGKGGKQIGVYKFRTMYAYSEYLQSYMYKKEGLAKGGKISDDYRINGLGRFMRKIWIDELPMLVNWVKGDMKLVGVRPLSAHYFSLYSKELQQLRIKTKPGLLPPFYADMPTTLEEIQESEKRYLEAYFKHPVRTDLKYFFLVVKNIVFRGKRSK